MRRPKGSRFSAVADRVERIRMDPARSDQLDADVRVLRRAAKRHRLGIVLGLVMGALGATYGLFAAGQVGSARVADGFDRPVARLARVVQGCGAELRQADPETVRERLLLAQLEEHVATNAHLLVLLVRMLIAFLLMTAGLAALSASVAEARLLKAFARLGGASGAAAGS